MAELAGLAAGLAGAELDGGRLDGGRLDGGELDGAELDGAELDGRELGGAGTVPAFALHAATVSTVPATSARRNAHGVRSVGKMELL